MKKSDEMAGSKWFIYGSLKVKMSTPNLAPKQPNFMAACLQMPGILSGLGRCSFGLS